MRETVRKVMSIVIWTVMLVLVLLGVKVRVKEVG